MAKYCTKCGKELEENINFCQNCGEQINKEYVTNTPSQNEKH